MTLSELIEKLQEYEGSFGPSIDVCIGQDPIGGTAIGRGELDERPYIVLTKKKVG